MSQIEIAAKRLAKMGATRISIFPGTNPNVTAEQVAAELNRSLDAIAAGDFTEIADEE